MPRMQFANHRPIAGAVATVGVDERRAFIKKTYIHLALAIVAFTGVSSLLYDSGFSERMTMWVFGTAGGMSWLVVMGAFVGVSYIADKWARSDTSRAMQYVGLGVYIVAQAVVFAPLLFIAQLKSDASVIPSAALLTLFLFAGLTGTVLITKKDFSFMRGALAIGGMVALGVIVAAIVFGFQLGILFAGLMMAFAGGSILYQTSQVMAHYRPTQYVSASLGLFASVALMFYYAVFFFMNMSRN